MWKCDSPKEESNRQRKVGMSAPPANDICSVCHGVFRAPCQANCSHWFCGSLLLHSPPEFSMCYLNPVFHFLPLLPPCNLYPHNIKNFSFHLPQCLLCFTCCSALALVQNWVGVWPEMCCWVMLCILFSCISINFCAYILMWVSRNFYLWFFFPCIFIILFVVWSNLCCLGMLRSSYISNACVHELESLGSSSHFEILEWETYRIFCLHIKQIQIQYLLCGDN